MDVYNREPKYRTIVREMEFFDCLPEGLRKKFRDAKNHASLRIMSNYYSADEELNSMFEEGENNGI